MRINFLTTDISDASGGAIYDKNFFEILKRIHPETRLYNDKYFINKYKSGTGLLAFNKYYKQSIEKLMDCDYLIINSRLYTRMMSFNIKRMVKKNLSTKLLVIHHHSNFMNNEGIRRIIHRHFEKRVLEAATELIIPNEYIVHQVKEDFTVGKIEFLPPAFEKKDFNISSLDSNILLFVGNIEYRKGIIYGLQAFNIIHEQFPNLEYHIVGKYDESDDYYQQLKKYIKNNNLEWSVIFEGRVSDEYLNSLYESAKLFLFPSLLEGYGWVMVEAMGRGVPVVAFDNTAMPYTVRDDINGLLISNKNVVEMAVRVCDLIEDKDRMSKLQRGALETYDKVLSKEELDKMTEEYILKW